MSSASIHLEHRLTPTEWAARLIPGSLRAKNCKGSESFQGTSRSTNQSASISTRHRRNAALLPSLSNAPLLKFAPIGLKPRLSPRTRNVFIVGAGGLGRNIARHLQAHPEIERRFCGFLDDRRALGDGIVGRTSELAEWSRKVFVDEVILATPHDRELILRVLREARRLRLDVKIALDLFGCEPLGKVERIGSIAVISLHQEQLPAAQLLLKRVLDIAGSAIALFLLAPLMALIAIFIKLDSTGPALYSAERVGRKGTPFRCHKFRTMVADADNLKTALREQNQRQGPFFKVAHDPRITRVGRFLRRFSLDELPQFLNVLNGEMSLVGPRPHPLDDFSGYAIEHLRRLDVTPGMTGLWQVTSREDPSFQTGMKLDVEYIRSWSLGMDLRILLKTAGAVLRGSGQ